MHFYALFEWFSGIFSTTTWNILTKLGEKGEKMDTKQVQKTRRYKFEPLWRYLGSKMAKIDRNGPKIIEWSSDFRKTKIFWKSF